MASVDTILAVLVVHGIASIEVVFVLVLPDMACFVFLASALGCGVFWEGGWSQHVLLSWPRLSLKNMYDIHGMHMLVFSLCFRQGIL